MGNIHQMCKWIRKYVVCQHPQCLSWCVNRVFMDFCHCIFYSASVYVEVKTRKTHKRIVSLGQSICEAVNY